MAVSEYSEILDSELDLLEKWQKFYLLEPDEETGLIEEPGYGNYYNKGDYSFYDRGNWGPDVGSLLYNAFYEGSQANLGLMTTRREWVDELISKDRTFLLHQYERKDFYDLEVDRLTLMMTKNRIDFASYKQAISSFNKIIPADVAKPTG